MNCAVGDRVWLQGGGPGPAAARVPKVRRHPAARRVWRSGLCQLGVPAVRGEESPNRHKSAAVLAEPGHREQAVVVGGGDGCTEAAGTAAPLHAARFRQ